MTQQRAETKVSITVSSAILNAEFTKVWCGASIRLIRSDFHFVVDVA